MTQKSSLNQPNPGGRTNSALRYEHQNKFATLTQKRKFPGALNRHVKSHRKRSKMRLMPKPASLYKP